LKAIILERNPVVRRKIERFFRCAGFDAHGAEDPESLLQMAPGAVLLGADAFDGETVLQVLEQSPQIRVVLWTAEPLQRALRLMQGHARISNILGRANFDSAPRPWELMMVLRRMMRPGEEGPKFAWYLNWGFAGFQEQVDSSATRDRVVGKVQQFIERIGGRRKIAQSFGEVAHELLMNAMYDAPVTATGVPKYAKDRKADLRLPEAERPILKLASDGSKLAIQVTDPFGGLRRNNVFGGLNRGLAGGQMDTSHGGAGLGLTVIHNNTAVLFFDVIQGVRTEVTGIFELETSHRDFRLQAKSLHFFMR
jgi:hypothetical protein